MSVAIDLERVIEIHRLTLTFPQAAGYGFIAEVQDLAKAGRAGRRAGRSPEPVHRDRNAAGPANTHLSACAGWSDCGIVVTPRDGSAENRVTIRQAERMSGQEARSLNEQTAFLKGGKVEPRVKRGSTRFIKTVNAPGMLHVVHHPGYVVATGNVGTFPHDKYALVMQALGESGVPMTVHEPEIMPRIWLEAVHDPAYVEEVVSCAVPAAKQRRIGFAIDERISRRSQLSPGGTWLAAKLALQHGYAANSAGGSHHALADTGAGYCVFNDLAVAAHRLIEEGDVSRILILDLDVHQGDGTAVLMAGRGDIFTLSLHAQNNFPARKARSSLDIALPDLAGNADYLEALNGCLPGVLDQFLPDLILLQGGVDAHVDDRLGRLALTDGGLMARDRIVASEAWRRGIPLASTLGGGYGTDRQAVALRHARTILALAAILG